MLVLVILLGRALPKTNEDLGGPGSVKTSYLRL
jgi:hypothetical protein